MRAERRMHDIFHEKPWKMSFAYIFVILMMVVSFYIPNLNHNLYETGEQAAAIIVDKKTRRSGSKGAPGKSYRLYYEFEVPDLDFRPLKKSDKESLKFLSDKQIVSVETYNKYNIGDVVTVYYTPDTSSPQSIIVNDGKRNKKLIWSGIFLAFISFLPLLFWAGAKIEAVYVNK